MEPEIVVFEENEESVLIEDPEKELENQMEQEETAFEIKLEVFVLVLNDDEDVFKVRDNLMKKLEENEEVEKVTKVYVNKSDTFIDEDNLKWHTVDVTLTSTHNSKKWKETYFRRHIFQNCCLWDTYSDYFGEISRKHVERRKKESRSAEMRAMGYSV